MKVKKKSGISKEKLSSASILVIILIVLALLYVNTGFLQPGKLDLRDLEYWIYEDGLIEGSEEFEINGSRETCWLLIHSYTATPKEMWGIGKAINEEFGDFVVAPRLEGHGEVPSSISGKNLSVWYSQIEKEFGDLERECMRINVLGSSFGGVLAIRLAEEKEIKNLYALNSFVSLSSRVYSPLPREVYVNVFSDILNYNKKIHLARINDLDSLGEHIAYWNMPYLPVKDSFPFIQETLGDLEEIGGTVFVAHSRNDLVASADGALSIYNGISSSNKEISWYDESNHILLMDYEREKLIEDILEFEKKNR